MIYLDNNASSCLAPGLLAYLQTLIDEEIFGNPSSVHSIGKRARGIVNATTALIREELSFQSGNVIYTSGATESLNLAIANLPKGCHVISSSMEHPAVVETLKHAPVSVSFLDPEPHQCAISLQQVKQAQKPDTRAIVLSWVNSEIGAKTDIFAIADFAKEQNLQFIVDATAIVGREKVVVPEGVTMLAFSGHKFHTLSGVGVLLVRPKIRLMPLLFGGGQQAGVRSGTENFYGIASLFYVFSILKEQQAEIERKILHYRDLFEVLVKKAHPQIVIHCQQASRVNNVSAIAFPGLEGEVLQIALDMEGVACGYGSACSSGATTAFKSLTGMKVDPELSLGTLRFSFSHLLSQEDIESAADIVIRTVSRLMHPR